MSMLRGSPVHSRASLAVAGARWPKIAVASALVGSLFALDVPVSTGLSIQQPVVVSDNPANFTPHVVDGRVLSIVQVGNTIFAGGSFSGVREANSQTTLARSNIFAFNATTGAIDPNFRPTFDGRVNALAVAPDGQSVFAGGTFDTVNGITRRKLVKLSATTGAVDPNWVANAAAAVEDLAVRGSRLIVGGRFNTIKGQTRNLLAAVDVNTSAVDPNVNVPFSQQYLGTVPWIEKFDVTADGSTLIAIGNFRQVAGQERTQIAMVNLASTPATLVDWHTDRFEDQCVLRFHTYLKDVEFSPDGSYFVVVTTGAYRANRMCDTASRWESSARGTGLHPTWIDWSGGDTSTAVAVTGTAVYVGGHQRWWNNPYRGDNPGPGAVPRDGIAALDPVNGLPLSWNPGRTRGVGVFAFLATPQGLWVGSDTDRIGGELHQKIALMPLAGGSQVPPVVPYALPNNIYNAELDGDLFTRSYDGATFGPSSQLPTPGVNLGNARGMFALHGTLYMGWSDGRLLARTFDGTVLGDARTVNLYGLQTAPPTTFLIPGTNIPVPSFSDHLDDATGMFYDGGRLYYAVQGEPRLYYRYFTLESEVVGANLFVSSTSADGIDWGNVRGMTLANDTLYFATAAGGLFRVPFIGGRPVGSPTQIGGPNVDGYNWASRGLFVFQPGAAPQQPTSPLPPGTVFADSFDGGDLGAWTAVTRLTIDQSTGGDAPPSARGSVSGLSAFARRDLGTSLATVCMSQAVNATSVSGANVVLMRLRTAGGGPVARLTVSPAGILQVRSDVSGMQITSGAALASGWNDIELCGTVGASGSWDLYLNGSAIIEGWLADTGTTGVGRVEIGDTAAKTWTINFDDVVVDSSPG